MNIFLLKSVILLWAAVLFFGFLLFGALRELGLLRGRLDKSEATTLCRLGGGGLKVCKKAPDFSLTIIAVRDLCNRCAVGFPACIHGPTIVQTP